MTPIKRTLAAAAAPVLLALSLTACGGGGTDASDASTSTSTDDFCAAVSAAPDDADTDDSGQLADDAHSYADKLKDAGTPSDMTADERAGFEAYVSYLGGVDADDVDAAKSGDTSAFGDNLDDITAYLGYVAKTCPDSGLADVPTVDPSDLESLDPSLPSLPSGAPS